MSKGLSKLKVYLNTLPKDSEITNKELAEALEMDLRHIQKLLNSLEDSNIIKRTYIKGKRIINTI